MDDSEAGCIGIFLIAAVLIGIGVGAHAFFHKCPSNVKAEEEAAVPVTHPAPTGLEVEWNKNDVKGIYGTRCGVIKDYDRAIQWRFIYSNGITILPGSEKPITVSTEDNRYPFAMSEMK